MEFERDIALPNKPETKQKIWVELWDCSGDRKYEAGWPTIISDMNGLLIVANPEHRNQEKEIENWFVHFICFFLKTY